MHLQKNHAAWIAIILACCCWTARAAQPYPYPHRDGYCPKGADCIPKRATYGFTPTRWRPWPAAEKPAAAQSEPESLPTPAKELPNVESDAPQSPAEESPLRPTETETEPAMPQTPGELPPAGLFDDTPPKPPNESDGQGEAPQEQSESAGGLPSAPPQDQLPAPDGTDKAPAKEDEDPFKDDPIPRSGPPSADPPSRGATKANPARNSSQASDRWRVGTKAQVNLAESSPTMRAAAPDEPGLLRVDHDRQAGRGLMPIKPPGVQNPLRSETAKPRENRIVPTVDWSADQVTASDEGGPLRVDHDRQAAQRLLPIKTPGVQNPFRLETAKPRENSIVPTVDWAADQVAASDEGGSLRVERDRQAAQGLLPIKTPAMRNPLRTEPAKPREDQVVPAADGSEDQVQSNDTAVAWKRNPLRTN